MIHLYRMTNTTGSLINNLNAGMIFDWDFNGASYATNSVTYDAPNRLGIVSDPSTPNRIGVRVLNAEGTRSFRALTSSGVGADNFTNTTKADWLKSGFAQTTLASRDIGMLIATGSFNIPAGGTVVVAFALCAGTSQADLQAVSQAAQAKYDLVLSPSAGIAEPAENAGVVGPVYALGQNAPNPFNPKTEISYQLAQAGPVSLAIYDASGRQVASIVHGAQPAGAYKVTWNGVDDGGRPVATGTYFCRLDAGGKTYSTRMVLLK